MENTKTYWALPVNRNLRTKDMQQIANFSSAKEGLKHFNPMIPTDKSQHMSAEAFRNSFEEHIQPKADQYNMMFSTTDDTFKELRACGKRLCMVAVN